MMPRPTRLLLLVEDDQDQVERFRRNVREFNDNESMPFKLNVESAGNAEGAGKLLSSQIFDCAVVDLRIPASTAVVSSAATGNELLLETLIDHAFPLVVHSAHVGELGEEVRKFPIKIVEKGGGEHEEILNWFCEHSALMAAMAAMRASLRKETARIFVGAILPHWKDTKSFKEGEAKLQKVITRQVVSYLAERLCLPHSEQPKHHLNEYYFRPPLHADILYTGDIVEHDNATFIIVTPQCNMANGYPEHFLLCQCRDLRNEWGELNEMFARGGSKQSRAYKRIESYANQQLPISQHFLPPCGEKGPWLADFKLVRTVSSAESEKLRASRIASIAPQFLPNLVQRFAAYLGRVGQPDLSVEELEAHVRESSGP